MSALDDHLPAYKSDFAYQFDNEIMLNWYPKRIMELTSPGSRVLELGIGHGYTCQHFSEYYDDYTVIDGSGAVIEKFREEFPHSNAKIIEGYFEDYSPSQKFDVIIMGFVLEHVNSPIEILNRYRTLIAQSGTCFVAVPNAECLHRRFGHAAGLLEDVTKLSPADVLLGHQRYYTVASLSDELTAAGYSVTRREGLFLKPMTTEQLTSLSLSPAILDGMCKVAVDYPELSAGLLFESKVAE